MTKTIAVIGAGQAGAQLCANLREEGFDGRIVLIGEEPSPPYQRPPLSKKYLLGEMSAERLFIRPEAFYAERNIELMLGARVEAIDCAARKLTLRGGSEISYDMLALTTGSRPRFLPESIGGALAGVHAVRTLADVDAMAAEFAPGRRVLIVGGGYVGLEAAAVAAARGLSATLVELAPRILARVAAQETADYFMRLHAAHGVRIVTGVGLDRLEGAGESGGGRVARAHLASGETLEIDFALVGVGIAPNAELAEVAGLAVDGGITVDVHCRTSDPHVFAAGDCAALPWRGRRIRLESVQNAIDQAQAAAANMAGRAFAYDPKPWFWSDQYDVKLQIAGLSQGHDRIEVRPGRDECSRSVWYFAGGALLAVDAMNDPRAYMTGKRWLEAGKSPDPNVIGDPRVDLKTLA